MAAQVYDMNLDVGDETGRFLQVLPQAFSLLCQTVGDSHLAIWE